MKIEQNIINANKAVLSIEVSSDISKQNFIKVIIDSENNLLSKTIREMLILAYQAGEQHEPVQIINNEQ